MQETKELTNVGALEFETKPIVKLIVKYSLAVTLGFILQNSYGIIDSIFVGHFLGTDALAAVSSAMPVFCVMIALALDVCIGSATLASIKLGEKDKDKAEELLGNSIVLNLIFSGMFMLVSLPLLHPLLELFGLTGAVLEMSYTFTGIMIWGLPLLSVSWTLHSVMRSDGSPNYGLFTVAVPLVIVVVLNPVYIYVFNWGIAGSALACVTADFITLLLRLSYYYSRYSVMKIHARHLRINLENFKLIFKCGSAALAGQIAAFFVFAEMLYLTNIYGGTTALAVCGVVERIIGFIVMPVVGISVGVQPIIGYNFGAGNYARMRLALNRGIWVATAIAVFFFAICEIFPRQILSIFDLSEAATELGVKTLRIVVVSFPVIGYAIVASEYFPAVNKPAIGVWLTLLRQIIYTIPPMYVLVHYFGLFGVFWALPFSDVLITVTTFCFLYYEFNRLERKELI
ncbi:MAG: MATE family efflux transporter [Negativicutes bacterium]